MIEKLLKNINAELESPYLDIVYEKALNDKDPFYLKEEYVDKMYEYKVIPRSYAYLKEAIKGVNKIEDLALFVKILYHLIDLRKPTKEIFTKLVLPTAPEGSEYSVAYDCVSAFAILAHTPKYVEEFNALGIEDDIIYKTVSLLDVNIKMVSDKVGKPVCDHETFISYSAYLYTTCLWVERFRFQLFSSSQYPIYVFKNAKNEIKIMMRDVYVDKSGYLSGAAGVPDKSQGVYAELTEGDDYYEGYFVDNETSLVIPTLQRIKKSEWELILKPGQDVVKIHVPFGGDFTPEVFDKTFKRGVEVMKKLFYDRDIRAICATSWFFGPALKSVLKETSNIMAFRNYFYLYPKKSSALDVYEFVFGNPIKSFSELDAKNLPEDNSLRRAIKEKTLNGTFFHEFGAFKLFE